MDRKDFEKQMLKKIKDKLDNASSGKAAKRRLLGNVIDLATERIKRRPKN
jgi:hypothetical protein